MNKLWVQVSLAFVLVVWLGIGAIVIVVHNATETGFRHYINQRDLNSLNPEQITRLQDYYENTDSWAGVETILTPRTEGSGSKRGAQFIIADSRGWVLATTDPSWMNKQLTADDLAHAVALRVNGEAVGWLYRQTPGEQVLGAAETAFLAEVNRWLVFAALAVTVVAIGTGSLLAWITSRPLQSLTAAARDLATGQLGRQVSVAGTAEVNQLTLAFNTMSSELENKERLRQHMAADVAHELRTPVSVLRGHMEALMDGIYPLDSAHLAVAYDQTIHLTHLVEDLRLLTQAEAGRLPLQLTSIQPGELVEQAVTRFEPLALDATISLYHEIEPNLPTLQVDTNRIQQVFDNLLTNALRHTKPDGRIVIKAHRKAQQVLFQVANTGEITPEDAGHLFDRFWRGDASRQRDTGGSGLGLAISQLLVTLHGGIIRVEQQGDLTVFVFELPLESTKS